jgi:heat shock protein HslJ
MVARSLALLGVLGMLGVLLAACSGSSGASAPTLGGTSWTVSSVGGQPTIEGNQPTILFAADGAVSGTSGCNQYNGSFTTDGGGITFSPMATTRMACEGPASEQEATFLPALQGATAWSIADGNLTLSGASDIQGVPAT